LEKGFSILEYGYLDMPRTILFGNDAEGRVNAPVVGFLVRRRDLTILYDTGYDSSKKYERPPRAGLIQGEENFLPNQLKALGLQPSNVDAVVVSHLHFDHAGFLHIFRNTGVPILIQESELRNAYYPDWAERQRQAFKKEDFDFLDLEYFELKGEYHIDNGLELIHLPGHTPGIQGLFAEMDNGKRCIFTSDAVYTLENFGPPRKLQGFDWNVDAWGNSVERIRMISRLRHAELFPGHDAEFYKTKKFAPHVYT
jgi:glyoxylase-like metal-dependent hydrolase (beta-lactamase superfamily II)